METLISRSLLDRVLAYAEAEPDREICGLLFGDLHQIKAIQPVRNVHPDPSTHFEADPSALIAAYRAERAGGPKLVGHYHSHPSGHAFPSAKDAASAEPELLWLIVAGKDAALFQAIQGGEIAGAFRPVAMRVQPD